MMRRTRPVVRGLTLIELIVGMGILMIVLVAVGYIFQQAVAAHNIASGQAGIAQEARVAFDYIGRELAGVPRDGRIVLTSPEEALDDWNVAVQSDVITFTTATPIPVRDSAFVTSDLAYRNVGAVCYYRLAPDAEPEHQILYRLMDRMDTGEGLSAMGRDVGGHDYRRIALPSASPDIQDQMALRVITPMAGDLYGAFEVAYYDEASETFLSVDGSDTYDSAFHPQGLPRAIRIRLRLWDRRTHVRDETTGVRGHVYEVTIPIPAAD